MRAKFIVGSFILVGFLGACAADSKKKHGDDPTYKGYVLVTRVNGERAVTNALIGTWVIEPSLSEESAGVGSQNKDTEQKCEASQRPSRKTKEPKQPSQVQDTVFDVVRLFVTAAIGDCLGFNVLDEKDE